MNKQVVKAALAAVVLAVTLGCTAWETVGHRKVDLAFNDAIAMGDLEEAKRLIGQGADINTRFTRAGGYTAVTMVAASRDYSQGLRFLLENGADPNIPTNKGQTALMIATSGQKPEYVSLLLAHGANPAVAMPDGATALSIAEEQGNPEILSLLRAAQPGPQVMQLR